MARRSFKITGTDTSTSPCVPILVGHEGVDGGDPVVTYCSSVWRDSVVSAKTGAILLGPHGQSTPGGVGPVAMVGACWLVAWGC